MQIRLGEHEEDGHIYAMAKVDDAEWGVIGFLPDFLVHTQGVLAEWRRFNKSVVEHFLRCQGVEFDTINHDGEEYDPISFDDEDE